MTFWGERPCPTCGTQTDVAGRLREQVEAVRALVKIAEMRTDVLPLKAQFQGCGYVTADALREVLGDERPIRWVQGGSPSDLLASSRETQETSDDDTPS